MYCMYVLDRAHMLDAVSGNSEPGACTCIGASIACRQLGNLVIPETIAIGMRNHDAASLPQMSLSRKCLFQLGEPTALAEARGGGALMDNPTSTYLQHNLLTSCEQLRRGMGHASLPIKHMRFGAFSRASFRPIPPPVRFPWNEASRSNPSPGLEAVEKQQAEEHRRQEEACRGLD